MNPTPSDASPDHGADGADRAVPAPRAGLHPLPRRVRAVPAPTAVRDREPGDDPEGRPFEPVDEKTLTRLLGGLREI